jgi:alkylation response protein AidB-like acyl-CoA dehydrogenase
MNLRPSDLQLGLAEVARTLLEREAPVSELVAPADPDVVRDRVWAQAAGQGWLGFGLPDEVGGFGLGLPEELMVFRELGRFATPGPYLPSALAVRVAVSAGRLALAERISTGVLRVGLVTGDLAVDVRPGDLALRMDDSGAELLELDGLAATPSMDPHSHTATFTGARLVLAQQGPTLISIGRVLAAAELLGIIEAVRDMSADYAKVRHQFGRPIGSFQAVKHRCADMAIAAVATVGQLFQAGLYVQAGHPDAAFHAASAYVLAARGAYRSAADNVQNHGGIGFTWEHPAHLYLKRAVVLENVFGPLRASLGAVLAPARHEFR